MSWCGARTASIIIMKSILINASLTVTALITDTDGKIMIIAVVANGRKVKRMTDETLNRIRTAINAEIAELHCNMGKHSKEVQVNAIMIVEGLRRALRIVEEIFLKDGDGNG